MWNQALVEFLKASPGKKAENMTATLHKPTGPPHQEPEATPVKHSHGCEPTKAKPTQPSFVTGFKDKDTTTMPIFTFP